MMINTQKYRHGLVSNFIQHFTGMRLFIHAGIQIKLC